MGKANAVQTVTIDTYIRAESDHYFQENAEAGAFGKWLHNREAPALDKQLVIRMNRDTLYSFAILDLSEPATVVMPDSGDRFQSMVALNQDQYIKLVAYDPGEYKLTQDKIGTRYVHIAVRTFADPDDLVNSVTAKRGADGKVAIHFGGGPGQSNYLAIMPGWNYIVRLYRPRKELIEGKWTFPIPRAAALKGQSSKGGQS